VTSLRALNTPFLITADTLAAGVVTDAGLTRRLASGLPSAGVSALGLYPEGLRHPPELHALRPALEEGIRRCQNAQRYVPSDAAAAPIRTAVTASLVRVQPR
jgi:hypothetical protein